MADRLLHRTTLHIWSEWDPRDLLERDDFMLERLCREAEQGDAYCSSMKVERFDHEHEDVPQGAREFFAINGEH